MIQPLRSSKTTWFVHWLDLEQPVPSGTDYFLPTLLIVCDASGSPLAAPDVLEELDQARVEGFLIKLFERVGAPDRLTICASDEWDDEAWRDFAEDNRVDIRFQRFDKRAPDELKALTHSVVVRFAREGGPEPRSKDVARGLVNTALRVRSARKKIALLRTALARDADCSTARIELADAEFQAGNWKSCLASYDEVIERERPRWRSGVIAWWSEVDTRPFLRALYGRGMTLWHQGRHRDAAVQFEALLGINPRDNQGARFFIPLLHLLADEPETAAAFFESYGESYGRDYGEPSFLFGWALSLGMGGYEMEAKAKYREAILKNLYIAPMLIEATEPPRAIWQPSDRADPSYAGEFIDSYAVLWDREPSALRMLREVWEESQPRVSEIVALRTEMADFQDQRYEPDYKKLWQNLVGRDEALTRLDGEPSI